MFGIMDYTKYVLGLDLGVGSVGWSVVELKEGQDLKLVPYRMLRAGVRVFSTPENPKNGEKLNKVRREKRSLRRVLDRKQARIIELKRLFVEVGLIKSFDVYNNSDYLNIDTWKARVEGLDKLISNEELVKAVMHIAKNRGFQSNRKNKGESGGGGKFKDFIDGNLEKLKSKGYRTYGEMFFKDETFATKKRNSGESYLCMVERGGLRSEMQLILESQMKFRNSKLSVELINKILEISFRQKSFSNAEMIKKMVGFCTFEANEKRAPKNSFSFEWFNVLCKLNNLRTYNINDRYNESKIPAEKMVTVKEKVQKDFQIKYSDIRKILELDDKTLIKGCDYYAARRKLSKGAQEAINLSEDEVYKEAEKGVFVEMKGFKNLNKVLSRFGKDGESVIADKDLIDEIAYILTVSKDDEECSNLLSQRISSSEIVDVLVNEISFDKFGHLSIKAIKKLLPYLEDLEEGFMYSEAVEKAYPDNKISTKNLKLPVIDQEEVRNPVVLRALTQARKVLNAIIDKYGSPTYLNIELARDLSRDFSERKKIEKLMNDNRLKTEFDIKSIQDLFGIEKPSGTDITKYRLWKEQNEQCLYTGKHIKPEELFSNATQIDHAIPYSRSMDDSYKNKVLVFVAENQNKKDKTPFEYLQGASKSMQWNEYVARVNQLINTSFSKRKNLLREDVPVSGDDVFKKFVERDLNDTRYISKYFKNFVEENLQFAESSMKRKVFVYSGMFTSVIKRRLGLSDKDREVNNRHHAIDATLVAVSNPGYMQRVSSYNKLIEKEGRVGAKLKEKDFHFPEPWVSFRKDVETRVMADSIDSIFEDSELSNLYKDQKDLIQPLFVSHAPKRGVNGQAHKDTVFSPKLIKDGAGQIIKRVSLSSLTKANIDSIYGDEVVKKILKRRLEEFDYKVEEAFKEPIFKPSKKGNPNQIKKVRVVENTGSVLPINGGKGVASNGDMVRVDIFTKDKKFYIVPIYVDDTVKKELPNRAIVAYKDEVEWTIMDLSYEFIFTLYPNDYVEIEKGGLVIRGYYTKTDRATGAISVSEHDRSIETRIGLKTVTSVSKYYVDPLGDKHLIVKEQRVGF